MPDPGHYYYQLNWDRVHSYGWDAMPAILRVAAAAAAEWAELIYIVGPRSTVPPEAAVLRPLAFWGGGSQVSLQGELPEAPADRKAFVTALVRWTTSLMLLRPHRFATDPAERAKLRCIMDTFENSAGLLMLTPTQFSGVQDALNTAGLARDAFLRVPKAPKWLRERWNHAARLASQPNRPLPDEADELIAALVEQYPKLSKRGRRGWQRAEARHYQYLGQFAERAASVAFRRRDWRYARLGVMAAALWGSGLIQPRPWLRLVMLREAVKALGEDPDRFFEESVAELNRDEVDHVRRFLAESGSAKTLEAVQLVETGAAEGPAWKDDPSLESTMQVEGVADLLRRAKEGTHLYGSGRPALDGLTAALTNPAVKDQLAPLAADLFSVLRELAEYHIRQMEERPEYRELFRHALFWEVRALELAKQLYPAADLAPAETDDLLRQVPPA